MLQRAAMIPPVRWIVSVSILKQLMQRLEHFLSMEVPRDVFGKHRYIRRRAAITFSVFWILFTRSQNFVFFVCFVGIFCQSEAK